MGGKIDCYLDIVSFYSYIAFLRLRKDEDLLKAHGIDVEFHPIFLGALIQQVGNTPPWILKPRGKYLDLDAKRVSARIGHSEIRTPNLVEVGNTVLPLRALTYIKSHYPYDTFLAALTHLFTLFWTPPNHKLIHVNILRSALLSSKLFPGGEDEVATIVEAAQKDQSVKDELKRTTQTALDKGAFGAPWLWLSKAGGGGDEGDDVVEEPVFGSDRLWAVWDFFDLPSKAEELLPPKRDAKL